MKLDDLVWMVDDAGDPSQVPLREYIATRPVFPFFATELAAVLDARDRFTALAGRLGEDTVAHRALIDRMGSQAMLAPVIAMVEGFGEVANIEGDTNIALGITGPVSAGDAMVAVIAWDGAGTLDRVKAYPEEGFTGDPSGAANMTLLSMTTTGGTSGRKLAVYLMPNLAASASWTALPQWSGMAAQRAILHVFKVTACAASPLDISVTASGSDAIPTTAASATTAAYNEVLLGALIVAGTHIESSDDYPLDPEGFTEEVYGFGDFGGLDLTGNWFTLFVWTRNVTAQGNYGIATTLPAAADWAIALHSFKGGPLS